MLKLKRVRESGSAEEVGAEVQDNIDKQITT